MNTILHITKSEQWEQAKILGTYRGDTLDSEGFIHCSTAAQVIWVANRFFVNQKGLVILCIDSEQVKADVRYEAAEVGKLFPHVYGELNIDAVFQVVDFEAGEDGFFVLPKEVISLEERTAFAQRLVREGRKGCKGREMRREGFDVGEYVDQMALLLDLQLRDEYREGVVANFERIRAIANLVNSFPLAEDIEVAPVFEP